MRRAVDEAQPSPITTLSTEEIDQRGLSTVQDALQALTSNSGPALPNSFSANGAFAAGASAVSLRGLSTNSTLVLFDGLRAAYYPLADDGTRNFVDLNTIPDDIVERVEVLKDGASSAYGADAIAGVVNIITKRQIEGLHARIEGGISSRGDAETQRLSLTYGKGDIDADGFNAYVSGFYYKSDLLKNSERPYPFNSDDLRNVCYEGTCGPNNTLNGEGANGLLQGLSTAANFVVRPYDPTNTDPQGNWQNLSACTGNSFTVTPADRAVLNSNGTTINAASPDTVCQVDLTNAYGIIQPNVERFGGSSRVTATIGDRFEGYAEFNFLQSTVDYTGTPAVYRGNASPGIFFPSFSTVAAGPNRAAGSGPLTLPIYVCPERVNCDVSPNRQLNPNNPFAAAGQVARLIGRDHTETTYNETRTRTYRAAFGLTGEITDNLSLNVGATASHVDLRRKQEGYVYIQHLLDVIADGTFNFIDPTQNSREINDYVKPTNITNASSDQYQLEVSLASTLAELPGGPLQVGFGGTIRYEAVDAPSANSDFAGPTQRYFTLNAFGAKGDRTVYSVFGEIEAPLHEKLTVNLSGRYDDYSTGQNNFSPKVGVKFTPIDQVVLRGTYSKGFRIPSFGEANALPTTGFVSNNASVFNDTYLAQYGCTVATFSSCPAYIRSGSYGQTTLASPNLRPEKSRSFTGGIVVEPTRNISFSIDYYNIKKTRAITQPSNAPALDAYYNGQPIPAGYQVDPDGVDPNFPNALPRVAFVRSQLINANTNKVEGLDFGAKARFNVTNDITFTSALDVGYIIKLETIFPDGTRERYDGTLGNFNLTAGSGTQKWKGYWLNTLDVGKVQINGTVNYSGGYDLSAQDQGDDFRDCGQNPGYSPCKIDPYVTFDLGVRFKLNDKFTFYANMLNVFDNLPEIDIVTYGAHLYNPVQAGNGILGRYFRGGVKLDF